MEEQKATTDFWQDHSLVFLEMAFRTDRRERLEKADGYAKKEGDCGDTVEFFINLDGHRIKTIDTTALQQALVLRQPLIS